MSGHTPGPWSVCCVGELVFSLSPDAGKGDIVCQPPLSHHSLMKWPENARLIAAAPELLEALQYAREWIVEARDRKQIPNANTLDRIDTAITKATGDAP